MAYEQFAYAYDRLMSEMPYSDWVKWTEDRYRDYGLAPKTAIDLGCGTGAITIPLAKSGMKVYGLDLSDDMLAIAHDKSEGVKLPAGASLMWMQGDLRNWELPESVDLVVSFCDCMNYLLEEADIEAAFEQVYHGLARNGLFLFDVHAPAVFRSYAEEQPFVLDEEDVSYIWTSELDEERMEIEHNLSIFVQQTNGAYHKIEEQHVQRAYEIAWLHDLLVQVGFSEIRIMADFTNESPNDESMRIFFAARKM
ncbi:class I SAM-dependent methyltransferase [Paenibacillus albiflavus]|uniref:Class I SAM-dependent methyltransferase n=1 Tax=Paenibacillus albiflavus TaxID=2545760 RepID=A0A4R4EG05_9BACL|nr:class I SAM-dependent methyltransferase [Paenibacillus albiflavus]TCZ77045.1 class I SAM-dependent methyltransferase [Paenibacillus albiflavus]